MTFRRMIDKTRLRVFINTVDFILSRNHIFVNTVDLCFIENNPGGEMREEQAPPLPFSNQPQSYLMPNEKKNLTVGKSGGASPSPTVF